MNHNVLQLSERLEINSSLTIGDECNCTSIVLPPPHIRHLVAGTEGITEFLTLGHRGAKCIIELLTANNIDLPSMTSILDFGCGCSRVLMHLSEMLNKSVSGTDYNQKLVAWSTNNVRSGAIYLNDFEPPTQHTPSTFDLIYALSIHTHLSEQSQVEWMSEFARILKPGGYLIFTTHGKHPSLLDRLTPREMAHLQANGIVVRDEELEGANHCFTVQSSEHVRSVICTEFDILAFNEFGADGNPPQDIFLVRRKS